MVKANGRKVESCGRIKDENRKLAVGEDEVKRTWKDYFEDLYYINTQEKLQSSCMSLMGFGEVITSEESQLGGLRWW